MKKQVVQSLFLASGAMITIALASAAFARPMADNFITIAGRGSAALALVALVLFITFKIGDRKQVR